MARTLSKLPMSDDRLGWHNFYAAQFEYWVRMKSRDGARNAEHLALWYLFLHLAKDAE
jgi:hypothetical protein